jgi:hypothetical protein
MQLPASDRAILFWAVCLPARQLFASHFALLFPALSRLLASLVGARWLLNNNFAAHGFFGGRAWRSSLRLFHGILWLVFAATGAREALYADVLLAAFGWTLKYGTASRAEMRFSSARILWCRLFGVGGRPLEPVARQPLSVSN